MSTLQPTPLEDRVKAACKLINPSPESKAECERIILCDIAEMNEIELMRVVQLRHQNKEVKKAAAQLLAAVRRLETSAKGFESFTGTHWNNKVCIHPRLMEELKSLRSQIEQMLFVRGRPEKVTPRRTDSKFSKSAVSCAWGLLKQFGRQSEPDYKTAGKLAAILIGRPGSNFSHHLPHAIPYPTRSGKSGE